VAHWAQGQHVALWGKTRSGKTYLCTELLAERRYVAALLTKAEDDTFKRFADYSILKSWKERHWNDWHVLVWPYGKSMEETDQRYRAEAAYLMDQIWYERRWTTLLDDAKKLYALGLVRKIKLMFAHCASEKSTIVFNDQRPFETVQEALSQTTHHLMFHQKDKRDVWRLAQANGENPLVLDAINNQLREYEFVHLPVHGEPAIVRNG